MIYITGDTHTDFKRFSKSHLTAAAGDYMIVCGDFDGVWNASKESQYWLKWLSDNRSQRCLWMAIMKITIF